MVSTGTCNLGNCVHELWHQPVEKTDGSKFDERITCNNWFEILNNREMIIDLITNGEKLGDKFYEKIKIN